MVCDYAFSKRYIGENLNISDELYEKMNDLTTLIILSLFFNDKQYTKYF